MDDKALNDMIRSLVEQELKDKKQAAPAASKPPAPTAPKAPAPARVSAPSAPITRTPYASPPEDVKLAKRAAIWSGAPLPVPPALGTWKASGNRDFYLGRTPARLGVGCSGTRYRTPTILSFLADHAAARDAVASSLDAEMLKKLGFEEICSAAADKREFLGRPDLGRKLSEESEKKVVQRGTRNTQVQIVGVDGLSATALNVNLPLVVPPLVAALKAAGIRVGTPFGIHLGRVASGDHVARLMDAELLCVLVGERPGLKTAESMGAYVTYYRVNNFNESMRSVISNIHQGGLTPDDAARQITALILRALHAKRTGVETTG